MRIVLFIIRDIPALLVVLILSRFSHSLTEKFLDLVYPDEMIMKRGL